MPRQTFSGVLDASASVVNTVYWRTATHRVLWFAPEGMIAIPLSIVVVALYTTTMAKTVAAQLRLDKFVVGINELSQSGMHGVVWVSRDVPRPSTSAFRLVSGALEGEVIGLGYGMKDGSVLVGLQHVIGNAGFFHYDVIVDYTFVEVEETTLLKSVGTVDVFSNQLFISNV